LNVTRLQRLEAYPDARDAEISQGRTMGESQTIIDVERTIEFEFARATENAALNVLPWMGRGDKEKADAACDAINGVFDLVDIAGEVVIGEGAKDNAPGQFLGDKLGTWKPGAPRFDIAVDPIDGTTNFATPGSGEPAMSAAG
jgi:fructose-1,6-bisphosphatase II